MTIQEKIEALTPEQREKFSAVKTEQELDAFLAEFGVELTAEERATLSEHLKAKNAPRELTDDEVAEAAGGQMFQKCPQGHCESTGFANVCGASKDCEVAKCSWFERRFTGEETKTHHYITPPPGTYTQDYYYYNERCNYYVRTMPRTYHSPKPTGTGK